MIEGRLKLPNGVVYQGEFHDNMFHGKGKLTLSDGREFESTWNKDIMDRKGKIKYPNGERYEGEIEKFKKHGKGVLQISK